MSGGSEDRAPAAMARAITVHVDTMKVANRRPHILILTLNTFSGDVLRLRPAAGVGPGLKSTPSAQLELCAAEVFDLVIPAS